MPSKGNVLVFGDAKDISERLSPALEEMGWTYTAVHSPADLRHEVADEELEAALICSSSAGDEVIAAVEGVRRERQTLPLLVSLDDRGSELGARLLEAGADDVIFAECSREELRVRIEAARRARRSAIRLWQDRHDVQLMVELAQTFATSLDFEDILFAVVQRIAEVVRVDRCSIILTSRSPRLGYVVASSEDPGVRDLPIDLPNYPEVQKVLDEGAPLFIDVATDPLLDDVRSRIPPGGPRTSALFPIMHESQAMGVLFLRFQARREELSERELALCQTVANATAISLRNARFVRALRDEQARISLAHTEAERKVEALSHYADFFESSADGMLVVDAEGKVLYANPRVAALTGLTVEELTRLSLADLVADEERVILGRLLAGFSRGAYPRGLDIKFRGSFDEQVVLSVSASSTLRLAQGVLLILRDVTAARATEAELRQTKEFLESLIAQSVDAIIAADMEGTILLFNPAAERIFGYSADEVLGLPMIRHLYPPGVAQRIMTLLCSEDYGGFGRLEQTRASVLSKDGTEIPISMTGGMILEGGEPRATFGIFTDLRERLEIENDLARTRLELMEREREAIAAQLAGAAAHELNQPLTSILASVELLRRRLEDLESHAWIVRTITDEAERMARIVRKIGRITKYETTTYIGSTQILDINRASQPEEDPESELTYGVDYKEDVTTDVENDKYLDLPKDTTHPPSDYPSYQAEFNHESNFVDDEEEEKEEEEDTFVGDLPGKESLKKARSKTPRQKRDSVYGIGKNTIKRKGSGVSSEEER